ncbi:hypothetical protein [Streptomyces sp. NPDC003480]
MRATTETVSDAVTGSLAAPRTVLLGRYDAAGRLQYTGRSTTLSQAASRALADHLAPPQGAHPWDGWRFSGARLLSGDVDHFTQLLDNAHHEATHGTAALQPTTHTKTDSVTPMAGGGASPGAEHRTTPPADPSRTGPDAVMKTFSKVLTEDHTVEDGRARLLHKLAEQNPRKGHNRCRPTTDITKALRQRKPPPATTITPLTGR